MRTNIYSLLVSLALLATFGPSALAQTIIPDSPATQLTQDAAQTTITGGTQSGSNLFHSFQQFNLDAGQTATFQTAPTIANIFSRITGGLPSLINGRLQIQGAPANLFLINPAGILFGTTAKLDLPAAFTATTAQGIEFGPGQWLAASTTDYSKLTGSPTGFGLNNSSAIVNTGDLTVSQSLTLLGGSVLNTGKLTAPGGTITIAALPGNQHVRLTPEGQVLSLDLPLSDKTTIAPTPLTPAQLPDLLTGQHVQNATQLTVENGQVRLTSGKIIVTNPGDAIVSGQLSTVADQTPSQINITGERIQLQEANIDASANFNAGKITIGGDFQGKGETYRAKTIQVDQKTQIHADSKLQGNGGEIAIWSDGSTQFAGTATARGGTQGGNGGKIETSGKQTLNVQNAQINAGSAIGKNGEWLLDPTDINIANTGGTVTPGTIETALDTNTDVTLSTAGSGADAGDINLIDSINQTGNSTAKLTLTGRRFTNPTGAQINLTSTGDLTFNLNSVNSETPAPVSSIQNAIDSIGTAPGQRTINLPSATYNVNSTISVDKRLRIVGQDRNTTILDGGTTTQVVKVLSNGDLSLDNIGISNGYHPFSAGGADNSGTLSVNQSSFLNNRTDAGGGAIHAAFGATGGVTVSNTYFGGNQAQEGGAIENHTGSSQTFRILTSTFEGNNAPKGGTVFNQSNGNIIVDGSAFRNSVSFEGGLFFNGTGARLDISNSDLQAGVASSQGGGIYTAQNSTLTLNQSRLASNQAGNQGGGIYADRANVTIAKTVFDDNKASVDAGAIFQNGGTVAVTTATFDRNLSNRDGGAIDIFGPGARLNLTDVGFVDNGGGSGGAIFADPGTVVNIRNSPGKSNLFQNNQARPGSRSAYYGGAIFNEGTISILGDTRFLGNKADASGGVGGAIFNGLGRTFSIDGGVTFTNNSASLGGGAIFNAGILGIANSKFTGNQTLGTGGAIWSRTPGSQMTILASEFIGNQSIDYGGAINQATGQLEVRDSLFQGNISTGGGAGAILADSTQRFDVFNSRFINNEGRGNDGGAIASSGYMLIEDSLLSGNISGNRGGAIQTSDAFGFGNLTIRRTDVLNNTAASHGGGIYAEGQLTAEGLNSSDNVGIYGGGLYASRSTATILDSIFSKNQAQLGGGLWMTDKSNALIQNTLVEGNQAVAGGGLNFNGITNVLLDKSIVRNNQSTSNGGGIAVQDYGGFDGTLVITESLIDQNEATGNGGGIDFNPQNTSVLSVDRSALIGNRAGSDGGGLSIAGSITNLSNTTIAQNRSNGRGGGVNNNNTTLSLDSVTITENVADADNNGFGRGGGIGALMPSITRIKNSLIANNRAVIHSDVSAGVIDQGNNLIGTGFGATGFTTSTLVGTNAAPIVPLLSPLGNYGGLTPTYALLPGSVAIDVGSSSQTVDQRGIARSGLADIGAFESRGFIISPQSGDGQTALINQAFANPLVLGVSSLFSEPVNGGQLLFSTQAIGPSALLPGNQQMVTIAGNQAQVSPTANAEAGTYNVQVQIGVNPQAPIATQFSITNSLPPVIPPAIPPVTPPVTQPVVPPVIPPVVPPVTAPVTPPVVLPTAPTPSNPTLPTPPAIDQKQKPQLSVTTFAGDGLTALDDSFTQEFQNYAQGSLTIRSTRAGESIQNSLRKIRGESGLRPAVIYAVFVPSVIVPNQQAEGGGAMPNLLRARNPSPSDRLDLVFVHPEGKVVRRSTVFTRSDVAEEMSNFRLINDDVENEQSFPVFGNQFYQWLLQPIEADLKGAKTQTLIYVLDEGLRSVPVSSMTNGGDWAINNYGISVVPSLGLLDQRVKLLKNQTVLAMGADRITGQEPLPAVPVELKMIQQQFGGAAGLLNQQFTYNGILQALRLRQPGILHLATHAEFNEGSSDQSLIHLWDRPLLLKDIKQLNLEALAPELLVLSACNTATGNPEAELGFTGLAALSGVKTAMGSLWQVSDLGTLALMSEFYSLLKTSASRTDALRLAQANLRDGLVRIEGDRLITSQGIVPLPKGLAIEGTKVFSHPYYWSGFTMVGNPW